MQRYRLINFDYDSTPMLLDEPNDDWEPHIKLQHIQNKRQTEIRLKSEFGEKNITTKIERLKEIGVKPFSIVSYHNKFLQEIRNSYIMGYNYTALVASCTLIERILNHLILDLREYYKSEPNYLKISRKGSFSKWEETAQILKDWNVISQDLADLFSRAEGLRNESIHFNLITSTETKTKALQAISDLQWIIQEQFSASNQQYYFMHPGEIYIKKEFENTPFVKEYILPCCSLVFPNHRLSFDQGWKVNFNEPMNSVNDDTDGKFLEIRRKALQAY